MAGSVIEMETDTPRADRPSLPDVDAAVAWAETLLDRHLSTALTYHCLAHTRDEVVPMARLLARDEGLDDEAVSLVTVGAWFHDIGQVIRHPGHEAIAVEIARQVLPRFAFSPTQVALVDGIIAATRLPQRPASAMEAVVADADLAVLGRPGFARRNHDLRSEMAAAGRSRSDIVWFRDQLAFVSAHRYHTAAARRRWDRGKEINTAWLAWQLAAAERRAG